MADLAETIEEAAASPAAATVDGNSATARPIADLIDADRYLASKQAVRQNPRLGMRITRAVPPGTV